MNLRTIAILRGHRPERTVELAEHCWQTGLDLVEVPVQDDRGWSALRAVADAAAGRAFGAGTVLDPGAAHRAVDLGAQVVISPGISADVVEAALARGVEPLPGVLTPSDVTLATRLEVRTCKLFPATVAGAGWLHALRGPFPRMRFVAVGGVDADNAKDFVAAGAHGVALGSSIELLLARTDARDRVEELHELIDTSQPAADRLTSQDPRFWHTS